MHKRNQIIFKQIWNRPQPCSWTRQDNRALSTCIPKAKKERKKSFLISKIMRDEMVLLINHMFGNGIFLLEDPNSPSIFTWACSFPSPPSTFPKIIINIIISFISMSSLHQWQFLLLFPFTPIIYTSYFNFSHFLLFYTHFKILYILWTHIQFYIRMHYSQIVLMSV